jgi:hypothetical protein
MTLSFRLEAVSTGLVAGEGIGTACGPDTARPPFLADVILTNLVRDLHVAIAYVNNGTATAAESGAITTDYWRQ